MKSGTASSRRPLAPLVRGLLPAFPLGATLLVAANAQKVPPPTPATRPFLQKYCMDCHNGAGASGGLDLATAKLDTGDRKSFALWVKIHDRTRDGEMPPKDSPMPTPAERKQFLSGVAAPLLAADQAKETTEGRATWRRLNRYEYENSVRDLLQAPWLQVRDMLPEDGESSRFNKTGDALDNSHVQMTQYLAAADYALHEVMAAKAEAPPTKTVRYHARDQRDLAGHMTFTQFNRAPERASFPVLDGHAQPDVRSKKQPMTVGASDPAVRDREALGFVAGSYNPLYLHFEKFKAPQSGHYKLRVSAYSVWVGPGTEKRWWVPDLDTVSPGHRPEPITIYSEKNRLMRKLGSFDAGINPTVAEMDVYLLQGETIRPDAARLFRSRPPAWHNPLATKDGSPGVAYQWLDVEGPILDQWPSAGHRLLFGDLPIKPSTDPKAPTEVVSTNPTADADRLMRGFLKKAYRRPALDADVRRFTTLVKTAMDGGSNFTDAMIAGYSAVLCSPGFVCLDEKPGKLDDYALANRLSYFLVNSAPDDELRKLAAQGTLHNPKVLDAQTERLLSSPKARRFTDAFLDYWLDLRKVDSTSPDAGLYPDYYLDDLLIESTTEETQLFFADLLRENLPARNVVSSDFTYLNERLAKHYGLPPVEGVALRRVSLPPDSPRGGIMTQASVLKVTANGTTTSPVLRGAWVMERILGQKPPPPPASVPAVEPDIRGATTIRAQLEKHRNNETCASCHRKIDPAGFALENFDVMGGWRDKYRALGDAAHEVGYGKNGQPFAFHLAAEVDGSGKLPDGRAFQSVRDLKKLLLQNERQVARSLTGHFVVYATGAPVRFGDRARVEQILDHAAPNQYGVRSIIHGIVQSDLFQRK